MINSALALAMYVSSWLSAAPSDEWTAFVDVSVVSMESVDVLENQLVLVRGELIEYIGPVGAVEVPEGANLIEGLGAYLMPGLIDLHVHVQDEYDLELYVLNGVTTIRECGGSVASLYDRGQIATGHTLGPQLFVATEPVVGFGEGLEGEELVRAAEELVRPLAKRGYDFLKLYGEITPSGYGELVRAARKAGIRPMGHIPRNLTVADVLVEPPDSIAHAEEFLYGYFSGGLDADKLPSLVKEVAESGVEVVTTLVTYDHIGRQVADLAQEFERGSARYASALQLRDWAPDRNRHKHFKKEDTTYFRTALAFQQRMIGAFHDAGIPILLGTDSGGDGIPFVLAGFSAHEELEHLVKSGLSAYEAIAAATREPARYLGTLEELGTVSVGKYADLALVWGNPLDDVANANLRAGVMVRGRWIASDEIHSRLDGIAELSLLEAKFVSVIQEGGVPAGRDYMFQCIDKEDGVIPFRERTLNELGYEAMYIAKNANLAVEHFRLNVEAHPNSWVAHDSLAEGLAAAGEREAAIVSYKKSLELYPGNDWATEALERLAKSD